MKKLKRLYQAIFTNKKYFLNNNNNNWKKFIQLFK